MDKVFGFPSFIRFGWSTAFTILNKDAIQCNFEEDDDEEDENIPSVSNFFKKQTPVKCNRFFNNNNLKRVDNFNWLILLILNLIYFFIWFLDE